MPESPIRISLLRGLFLLTATGAFAAPPAKPHSKISQDAASATPDKMLSVIIQYKQDPGVVEENTIAAHGGSLTGRMHTIHAHAVNLRRSELDALANDPNVTYISIDRKLAARGGPAPTVQSVMTSAEYTSEPINAPQVWAKGYLGTNIGVALIDSGVAPNPDLNTLPPAYIVGQPAALQFPKVAGMVAPAQNGRIVYSQNFVPGAMDATDQYGHGTHIAGLIAGSGQQSTGTQYFRSFRGSAPNANIVNLRVLDATGSGSDSTVIAAIEQAIALKSTYNIKVINLSLGRPIWESYMVDPLCQAVEQAWKAGIVVVVAAGNDGRDLNLNAEGYGTIEAPGNDPYVITVGAMNTKGTAALSDDVIASYSSKGPSFIDQVAKPDLVAPGNLVSSLYFKNDPLTTEMPGYVTLNSFYMNVTGPSAAVVSNAYFPLSGTSMSTGVVSGAVALLEQAAPNLTPDQMKAFLMRDANHSVFPQISSVVEPTTGTVYRANYDVFTIGAGYLDINAAITDYMSGTVVPAGAAMSPIASFNTATGNATLNPDSSSLWSNTVLWGASSVYGSTAFVNGNTVLWGAGTPQAQTVLWGATDPNGFSGLWSNTVLWGAGTPQAATVLWGAGTPQAATVLWGATDPTAQTILWGAGANVNFPF